MSDDDRQQRCQTVENENSRSTVVVVGEDSSQEVLLMSINDGYC